MKKYYNEVESGDINVLNEYKKNKIPYYFIDNKISSKTIGFFGNCHMFVIAFFFNIITNKTYNIYIFNSWFFNKELCEKKITLDEYYNVSNQIKDKISNLDILVYMEHNYNYLEFAKEICQVVKVECQCIKIPNIQLMYLNNQDYLIHSKHENYEDAFKHSLDKLIQTINNSDFPELIYIVNNLENNYFFRSPKHPTYFVLFIITDLIKSSIYKISKKTIDYYYSNKNLYDYLLSEENTLITLPNPTYKLTEEEIKITKMKYIKDEKIDLY
jgi:hypothetical protein